jgi:hypothetical protein
MTALPTVRSQLHEAAERQASSATASPHRRFPIGALVSAAGGAVALAIAILAIVALGHHAMATRSPEGSNPVAVPSREPSPSRLLAGNGISAIHFGETPTNVDSQLARLLGRPEGSYTPSICGLDHESYWVGLDVRPKSFQGVHLFRAQLFVYFKRSRFVGYVYTDDQAISRSTLNDETHIPLNSPQGRNMLRGPRLTLATAKGLAPGDPLAKARQLYGQAFVETTQAQGTPPNPRLGGAPIWEIQTPSGRLYGWIDNAQTANSFYENPRRSIASISAGETPNTPCR